jgi:hypothetical protein
MIILSHRGYWKEPFERNRPVAFNRSFDLGFGTETDIRDRCGQLVISHDMPDRSAISLTDMLDILGNRDLPIAINIKADGLANALATEMQKRGLALWFTFDMSVPEMLFQLRLGLPVFTRASEFERQPPCYEEAIGIWLDGFHGEWFGPGEIKAFLDGGKRVCIVSPELHGRDRHPLWTMLRAAPIQRHPKLMLCTDIPEEAAIFFAAAS